MRIKQGKPKKSDRRYRIYSPESLLKAYNLVKTKGVSVRKASRMFCVPDQTLRDRVKGLVDPTNFTSGSTKAFTTEQEETIVRHMETMAELGYRYTNDKLKSFAGEKAYQLKIRPENNPMSNNWLYAFLKRWDKRLSLVKPSKQQLENDQHKSSTPEIVDNFCKRLDSAMEKYNLYDKPQFIYFLEEIDLSPTPSSEDRPAHVINNQRNQSHTITSPQSTTVTMMACTNGIGNTLPPYFVFKGKRFKPELMDGAMVGAKGAMSDSGWPGSDIFQDFLKKHLLLHARPGENDTQQAILLICNGRGAHSNPSLIQWASERNILQFVLPAQTSHLLMSFDYGVFGPFKSQYYAECPTLTRFEICGTACKTFTKAMVPARIQSGLRKTGIYPLDSMVLLMEKLSPSDGFKKNQRHVRKPRPVKIRLAEKGEPLLQTEDGVCTCPCYCGKRNQSSKMSEMPQNQRVTKRLKISISGGQKRSKKPTPNVSDNDENSDSDEEDREQCCICEQQSPPNLHDMPNIKIVKWAQCDQCEHWTHLSFCTTIRAVRRKDLFLCPHCDN